MPGVWATAVDRGDRQAQPPGRSSHGKDARGCASGPAEGVAPDPQRRPRSARCRGGLGALGVVALQHRELRAGVEGDPSGTERSTPQSDVRGARIGSPDTGGRAPIVTNHSGRCTPTCLRSGTRPRTVASTRTRSSRDRSGVCGGGVRTAEGIGRHRRCRAGGASTEVVPPVRSGWREESNSRVRGDRLCRRCEARRSARRFGSRSGIIAGRDTAA